MFTQCPKCDTIFQLTASQLKAANGDVRCGQCLSVFNALGHLSEEAPHTQETDNRDDLAHDAHQYRDWSGNAESSTANTPSSEANDDVFSEVIAEASAKEFPDDAIDQFEEFLATDERPTEDSPAIPANNTLTSLDEDAITTSTEDSQKTEKTISTDDVLIAETSLSADQTPVINDSQPAESEMLTENSAVATDEVAVITDASNFGDVDNITAESDAKTGMDDDEFAELDAYLNSTEDEYPDNITGPVAVASSTDTAPEQVVDTNAAEASTGQTSPIDEPQTINIPTLILDDLHAAKAEQMRPSNIPWVIGSVALMFVLVMQVVYSSRDDLAKDAKLRPWLIQMCDIANCTLNQPFDITQIEIIGRDVRSHPSARKALVVSTTLINNADFIQPFPLLTMVFSDINGSKIAQRRFTPREYLHNDIDFTAGMTPDMPVRIELELVDPGKAAVNYEFRAEIDPRRTRPLS